MPTPTRSNRTRTPRKVVRAPAESIPPIRERLRELERSHRWLARKLGMPEGTVLNYLAGYRPAPAEWITRARQILGMENGRENSSAEILSSATAAATATVAKTARKGTSHVRAPRSPQPQQQPQRRSSRERHAQTA